MTDYGQTENRLQAARLGSRDTEPEPSDPTISRKAAELHGHLNRLGSELYRIREKLLGPVAADSEAKSDAKRLTEPCLTEQLWRASEIAAGLCDEASTILSKL